MIGTGIKLASLGAAYRSTRIRDVIRVDPQLNQVDVLVSNAKAADAVELKGGHLVILTTDNKLKGGDRTISFEGLGLTPSPDLRAAAAYGPGGIINVEPGSKPKTIIMEPAYSANWLPDESGLLYTSADRKVKVGSSTTKPVTEILLQAKYN